MKSEHDYIAYLRQHNSFMRANSQIRMSVASFEAEISKAFRAGQVTGRSEKSAWEEAFGHKSNETPKPWWKDLLDKLT